MKFPSFMKNGRFQPPKCRGKLQKMGVLYTHSPKMPNPSLNTRKKFKKSQKVGKKGASPQSNRLRAAASRRPLIAGPLVGDQQSDDQGQSATNGRPPAASGCPKLPSCKILLFLLPTYFCTCRQLLLVGSSTCPPCPDFS
jgi:hypothetical protein